MSSKSKPLHKLLTEAYLIRSYHPAEHAHVLKGDILKEIYDSIAFDRGGIIWEWIWNTDEIWQWLKKRGRSILEARVWHI